MSSIKRLSPPQSRKVNSLVRRECCNCDNGHCILLDDGDECVCPQLISYSLLCKWFRIAVLPLDKLLYDVAAASVLLESKLNTSNFSVMPDKSIHLYDYVENAGKVSALLSANNITIYQLAQSGDSLETYYTNLIGGCQND